MGFGASKNRSSTTASPTKSSGSHGGSEANHTRHTKAPSAKPAAPASPPTYEGTPTPDSGSTPSTQDTSRETESPFGARGFNNPKPARRETVDARTNNRQTRMVGAEGMDGKKQDLDERPFRQERVNRVPTKALLRPPKNPNSVIADPDMSDAEYETS